MTRSRSKRRCRRQGGLASALMRATLLLGPLVLAVLVGFAPRSERALSGEGIDMTMTGSVKPSGFSFAMGGPAAPSQIGPCLRFPDGSQRGAC